MKRFFSLLALLVMIVTTEGYVHAQTTYEISNNSDAKPIKGDGSPWTFVSKEKTFKITYTDSNPEKPKTYATGDNSKLQACFKCSNGYEYTLTIPEGLSISKITFNGYSNNDSKSSWLSYNGEEKKNDTFMGRKTSNFEAKSYTYDWPANTNSITFKPCNSETVLTITLTEAVNSNQLVAPSIEYTQVGLVTIKNNDSRTSKIYYTTDGTDPSETNGTEYTEPFSAPGKQVRAIAIASDGMENSDIVSELIPVAIQSTDVKITNVTVDGTPIESSELGSLIANKELTLSNSYAVAPAVVFTKTTTRNYNDGSKESFDETVDATVTESGNYFMATTTIVTDGPLMSEDTYTIYLPINKAPVINADVTSFDFSVKRADIATQEIKFSAVNTSGVLTVNVPQVKGLSVKMTHVVTDAENKQKDEELQSGAEVKEDEIITMTVSYQSDVVVEKASDKITLAVGETTLDIPFTYEDTENMISTIEDVTGDMTWNFTDIANADINSPRPLEVVPYDNEEGFVESFGSKYLKAQAQNFYRKEYQCYQGTELVFHTTVPGHVKILFTNPNSKTTRTAKINGVICNEDGIKGGKKETAIIAETDVPAGDVTIQGWLLKGENGAEVTQDYSQLRIYTIEFTAASTADIKVTSKSGLMTFSSTQAYKLPEGLTAYTATCDGSNVTLNKVEDGIVAANQGVILGGTYDQTYTLTATTDEGTTDWTKNELKNTAAEAYTIAAEETNVYVLICNSNNKGQFARLNGGQTIPVGKAYLALAGTTEAKTLSLSFGGETTGINTVETVNAENNAYYTLSGQKTLKPAKGLYIHNGKKYIAK